MISQRMMVCHHFVVAACLICATVAQDPDDWSEVIQEAEEQWSEEEEVAIMVADLKEIGMVAFIRKYYLEKGIPIRKLLMAFGVLVVRASLLVLHNAEVVSQPQDFDQEVDLLKVLKMACGRMYMSSQP